MTRVHNGLRVPWVTRWTNDVVVKSFSLGVTADGLSVVGYDDQTPEDVEFGILWQRENSDPTGEPEFAQVSTLRQRMSMVYRICQVCGRHIETEEIRWLMVKNQLQMVNGKALTFSPPTCDDCVPVALRLCPALNRSDYLIARVKAYEVWGVMGERAWVDGAGEVRRANGVVVKLGSPEASSTIAKQIVVELTDYTIEGG